MNMYRTTGVCVFVWILFLTGFCCQSEEKSTVVFQAVPAGYRVDWQLFDIVDSGEVKEVEAFLSNEKMLAELTDWGVCRAFDHAAKLGELEILKMFIENKTIYGLLNGRNYDGINWALGSAAGSELDDVVIWLLKNEKTMSKITSRGVGWAFSSAIKNDAKKVLKVLRDNEEVLSLIDEFCAGKVLEIAVRGKKFFDVCALLICDALKEKITYEALAYVIEIAEKDKSVNIIKRLTSFKEESFKEEPTIRVEVVSNFICVRGEAGRW